MHVCFCWTDLWHWEIMQNAPTKSSSYFAIQGISASNSMPDNPYIQYISIESVISWINNGDYVLQHTGQCSSLKPTKAKRGSTAYSSWQQHLSTVLQSTLEVILPLLKTFPQEANNLQIPSKCSCKSLKVALVDCRSEKFDLKERKLDK